MVQLGACSPGMEWMGDRTIEQYINNADRGDWLLWLAEKINIPFKELTLAKGRCAETVIHLMKDERSKAAVKAAIDFGSGLITEDELAAAANAATVAFTSAATFTTFAAFAASSADAVASAVAFAAADAAAFADTSAARKKNRQLTADICKQVLGKLLIDNVNQLLNK